MELHLYPDMVILPDFCFFVYSFAKKNDKQNSPEDMQKKVRQYTIYNNFLQFIKKVLALFKYFIYNKFRFKDGSPSGQRGQTVNLLATLSKVRILLHPSKGSDICLNLFCYIIKLYYKTAAPSSVRGCVRARRIRSFRFVFY